MIRQVENPYILELLNKHQKPLKKWPYIIALTILTGIMLSICNNEWHWFSRSGSLVVICGLFIAKLDLTTRINQEDIDFLDPVIIRNIEKNGNIVSPQRMEDIKKELRAFMIQYNRLKYISMEFYTFAIGTFIWGFGGLIGVIIQ